MNIICSVLVDINEMIYTAEGMVRGSRRGIGQLQHSYRGWMWIKSLQGLLNAVLLPVLCQNLFPFIDFRLFCIF
jgi:hypothetical protein